MRKRISGSPQRPRLCVFRSLRQIYAQVIDDAKGTTMVSASSLETSGKDNSPSNPKLAVAAAVGKLVAERALASGIKQVVFDRGGYKYHGRVKALAEASREVGLQF